MSRLVHFWNRLTKSPWYYGLILVLCFFIAGQVVLRNKSPEVGDEITIQPPSEKDIRIGSDSARFKILIYTDYECPFCRGVDEEIPRWIGEFGSSTVAFYLRHFPLTSIHPHALEFAKTVECTKRLYGDTHAFDVGKLLFDRLPQSAADTFHEYAAENTSVVTEEILLCTSDAGVSAFIETQAYEALVNEMRGTPSYAIYDSAESRYVSIKTGGAASVYDPLFREFFIQHRR